MQKKLLLLVLLFTLSGLSLFAYNTDASSPKAFKSIALLDTVKPVIIHTHLNYWPRYSWPQYLTSAVVDSSGIDSVWVKWYKNTPGTMNRQFRLNNTSGNNYNGTFNSNYNEVTYYDIIYYRIFAQDNSANHNKDSTQLFSSIISEGGICWLGNGTDSSKYPFTTYWMDGRTQMLFTKQELDSNGTNITGGIKNISFHVFSNSPQVMNGFSIKFQHTTATSITGFVSTNWTTAFSGTYSVTDTGWQTITFPYPIFWYNGTSNLLVEICFDNSAYTQYSYVYGTQMPGKTWGYYTDNATGCYMTGGASQSIRPNVRMSFQYLYGINGNKNSIPEKLSLSQNYPNPFNPVTRIDFDVPKKGFVSLKVFDILGREVQTLINENKEAGRYSVDFNGSDLTSGVYFYTLSSGNYNETKKMLLIK
jgi:hypothetical protein